MNKTFRALFSFAFLGLILFVVTPQSSYAGETFRNPRTASKASFGGSGIPLTGGNNNNCYAPQDYDNTITGLGSPMFLSNFNFNIPASDIITGIKVEIEIGSANSANARMLKAGNLIGSTNTLTGGGAALNCNSADVRFFGDDTQQWGTTWTPSDVNNTNFGVRVHVNGNRYAMIDWVRIRVYHNSPDVDMTSSKDTIGSVTTTSMGDANSGAWTWQIQVDNLGIDVANYTSSHTILRDVLPAGPTYGTPVINSSSGVSPLPNCSISSNVLTCNANPTTNINGGGWFIVDVPATPNSTGTYTNAEATCIADPNDNMGELDENNNNCDPSTVTVTASDIGVTKSSGGATPDINVSSGQWTWTYGFTTSGEDSVFSDGEVIFLDELPTNATYGAVNQSSSGIVGTIDCAIDASSDLECTANGTVTFSSGNTMSLDFTVTPDTFGTFTNPRGGGTCTIDPARAVNDGNPANDTCSDSVTVTAPNLNVTKNDSLNAGTIEVNSPFTWVISVNNDGNGDATFTSGQVILRDVLPDTNVNYGAISVNNPTNISGTGSISCSIVSFTLECIASGGTIIVGDTTGAFDVDVTTTLQSVANYTNPRSGQTCATDPDGLLTESDESDNTCSDTVFGRTFADLAITKSDGVTSAVPGGNVTYTIVVTNNGAGDVTNAHVIDTFPAGFSVTYTSVAIGGASGNTVAGAGNLNETLNMPNGSSVTYTVTATIPSDATGTISNTATVSASGIVDSNSGNNSATDSDTVLVPEADLSVTKTNNTTGVAAGQNTTYTITVTNNGPSDASNVVVTDTLDADFTLVSTSGCAEDPSGVPTCTLGTIVAGANASYDVTVTVDGAATGTVTNTVSVSSAATDNNAGNDSTFDTDTIVAIDLTIAKTNTASLESIGTIAGARWDWNVVVANTGTDNAVFTSGQTILTDQLPIGNINYGSVSIGSIAGITNSGNILCSINTGLLTCSASGTSVTITGGTGTFTVNIPATATASGTYTNLATTCLVDPNNVIGETDEGNTCGSDNSVIVAAPDLQASKSNSVTGTTILGNTWDWSIILSNPGTGLAEFADGEIIFSDSLPDTNIIYSSLTVNVAGAVNIINAANITCSIDGSFDLLCRANGATVSFGASATITLSFTATPTSVGTYTNPRATDACEIDPTASNSITESDESNNTCSDTVTVNAPNLTATKDDAFASGLASVNIPFTWVIHVENSGTADASFANTETIVLDMLPLTSVNYGTVTVTNVTNTTGTIDCAIDPSFDLTCVANGSVTIGSSTGAFDVEIVTTLLSGGSFTNPRTTNGCSVDPDSTINENLETDNTCQDTIFGQEADLIATKANNVANATAFGTSWIWTSTVSNQGVGDAIFLQNDVIFIDNLPNTNIAYAAVSVANQTGISGTGSISCSVTTFTISCTANGGTVIIADTTGSFDVLISATPSTPGIFANPRSGGFCSVDPNNDAVESDNANNNCSNSVTVSGPDLVAVKTNNVGGTVLPGRTFIWSITIANTGSEDAVFSTADVVLNDDMPVTGSYAVPAIAYSAGIVGTVSCTTPAPNMNCTADSTLTILGGETITINISVTTPSTTTVLNNPEGGSCEVDPNNDVNEGNEANNACADSVGVNRLPDPISSSGTSSIQVVDPGLSKVGVLQPGQIGLVGENIEWQITVTNTGSTVENNVVLVDNIVSALQVDSVSNNVSSNISGQVVTVTIPTLNPRQSVIYSIFTTVLQSNITVNNTVCASSNNRAEHCASGQADFPLLAVEELPTTGENPNWRNALLAILGLGSCLIMTGIGTLLWKKS